MSICLKGQSSTDKVGKALDVLGRLGAVHVGNTGESSTDEPGEVSSDRPPVCGQAGNRGLNSTAS